MNSLKVNNPNKLLPEEGFNLFRLIKKDEDLYFLTKLKEHIFKEKIKNMVRKEDIYWKLLNIDGELRVFNLHTIKTISFSEIDETGKEGEYNENRLLRKP